MRMERGTYQIDKEKHKKLMSKFIADNMNFNEFLDRIGYMYLEDAYQLDQQDNNKK